ncbi:MAG: hypothetical protein JXA23_10625, partial [Bacteroidales bacterium]|nr:hypothetical protein [Bacteroidales bacterium]
QAYSPMTIRFFILQAHYRSTLDFSNEALQAAEKGLKRLMQGWKTLNSLQLAVGSRQEGSRFKECHCEERGDESNQGSKDDPASLNPDPGSRIPDLEAGCYAAMNDDFNSPVVIANLFEAIRIIHAVKEGKESLSGEEVHRLNQLFRTFITEILALEDESAGDQPEVIDNLMELIIGLRQDARERKDWAGSDQIRDDLAKLGIVVKDTKEGPKWERKN